MVYKIKSDQRRDVSYLFEGIEDSMVIAYLQGYMGDAYVDKYPNPTAGMIISGEYTFFGGNPSSEAAAELAQMLFTYNPSHETVAIFSEENPDWEKTLLAIPENNPVSIPRFGIVQKNYNFDEALLRSFINKLPGEFMLKPFDTDLYEQAMSEDWSREFCETFESAEDYLGKGFGYAATIDGKLVSGTSTMTVYDGGTEIQVATHPNYRKRGLALPTSAAFILEATKRKVRPCWDAANETSLHMALKLGYEYKGEYITVGMHKTPIIS